MFLINIFRAIFFPFKPKLKLQFVLSATILIILCSVTMRAFAATKYRFRRYLMYFKGTAIHVDKCFSKMTESESFYNNLIEASLSIWLPLIIITVIHVIIFIRLRKQAHARSHSSNTDSSQQMKRILKTFIVIVCAFYVCTLPKTISYTYVCYLRLQAAKKGIFLSNINKHIYLVHNYTIHLMVMSSCLNPIIYSRSHEKVYRAIQWFRNSCKRLFSWIFRGFQHYRRVSSQVNVSGTTTTSVTSMQRGIPSNVAQLKIIECTFIKNKGRYDVTDEHNNGIPG